jgi:hypothetical protein
MTKMVPYKIYLQTSRMTYNKSVVRSTSNHWTVFKIPRTVQPQLKRVSGGDRTHPTPHSGESTGSQLPHRKAMMKGGKSHLTHPLLTTCIREGNTGKWLQRAKRRSSRWRRAKFGANAPLATTVPKEEIIQNQPHLRKLLLPVVEVIPGGAPTMHLEA